MYMPRVGHNTISKNISNRKTSFQCMCPMWGTTSTFRHLIGSANISMYAPLVGRNHTKNAVTDFKTVISIYVPRAGHNTG